MLLFAAAVFFLLATPGPGVLSTAGVGAAFGRRPGLYFVLGLCIGTNVVAIAVVSGMAAAVLAEPLLRVLLYGASLAYLLYLAGRIAFAGSKLAFIRSARPPGVKGALALQALNPKAYAVNTALFAGFPILPDQPLTELLIKFAIVNAIWVPIHLAWLWAGIALNRLDLSPRKQRTVNIAMALSMLAVVAIAALAPPGS